MAVHSHGNVNYILSTGTMNRVYIWREEQVVREILEIKPYSLHPPSTNSLLSSNVDENIEFDGFESGSSDDQMELYVEPEVLEEE